MIVRESHKQWKYLNKDRTKRGIIIFTIIACALILLFKYFLLPTLTLFYGSHPILTWIIGIVVVWITFNIIIDNY